jgi:hypothetical protein
MSLKLSDSRRTYRIITGVLAAIVLVTLAILAWALIRLPSTQANSTVPPPRPPTQTPIPPLAGVSDELLVCQRQATLAMHARQMVGAANLADDRQLRLRWLSIEWPVEDLEDALPGVILGLDVAAEVWQEGCAVYDLASIEVYDRRQEQQVHRLTVQAHVRDLLRWRAGDLRDSELLDRLEVTVDAEK